MPLYEYQCQSCGKVFEVMQKFSDQPLTVHEACGGEVQRLISAPAIQFKGSGWYITDYARAAKSSNGKGEKGEKSAEKGESKSERSSGESSAKSETKTESKPAAKADK
jgi:putative FmdB family regulatory protein